MEQAGTQHGTDWLNRTEPVQGIERIEAFFRGNAYGLHRHDTYAIGCTMAGVQAFNYRGGARKSLPGHTMVLHPDEAHDGQAGTDEGFRYRMVYVDPALIQGVLGGKALPFIEGGMTQDPRLLNATKALLQQRPAPSEPLEELDAVIELALALEAASGAPRARTSADFGSAQLAHEYLQASWQRAVSLDELAAAAGRDRWSLSRDFRSFYGTSPYRFLTLRRLDAARRLMLAGSSLADAAAAAGFADQSHMTRHFTQAYGISPARWLRTQGVAPGGPSQTFKTRAG
jgi:AraC-like DNA-binding protein